MTNTKPVAPAVDERIFSPTKVATGNVLDTAYDPDGDQLWLAYVNGERVSRTLDKNGEYMPLVVEGKYGTLSINAFGGYTYKLFDSVALSLKPGQEIVETFSFKITDGKGGTDFDYLKIHYDMPEVGEYLIDFQNAPKGSYLPDGYDGFDFGSVMDGGPWQIGVEGKNHFVHSDPFDPFITRVDGKQFIIEDVKVATWFDPEYKGTDSWVTFTGWNGNQKTGSLEVLVYGDTIASNQHISLASLGPVDAITFTSESVGEHSGYAMLAFDDFRMLV